MEADSIRAFTYLIYLDLKHESSEAGDEVCEGGVFHTRLFVLQRVAQLHHLLGFVFTTPPQLCGMVSWNHALIRSKLDGHIFLDWSRLTVK